MSNVTHLPPPPAPPTPPDLVPAIKRDTAEILSILDSPAEGPSPLDELAKQLASLSEKVGAAHGEMTQTSQQLGALAGTLAALSARLNASELPAAEAIASAISSTASTVAASAEAISASVERLEQGQQRRERLGWIIAAALVVMVSASAWTAWRSNLARAWSESAAMWAQESARISQATLDRLAELSRTPAQPSPSPAPPATSTPRPAR